MNLTALKSPAFWISAITAIVGLLISQGVVLSGSAVDQVFAYVLALAGALTGHTIAAGASAPAAPTGTSPTGN